MAHPTLLMIRPIAQAMDFVQAFTAQTTKFPKTLYSPLIDIQSRPIAPPTQAQFLLFSSVNGVKFFADQTLDRTIPVLCVGDTTAKAAQDAGFATQSAKGTATDLLDLVKSVADPENGAIVYVCGTTAAHDLDGHLRDMGYTATRCVVYEQIPQILTKQALLALQGPAIIPVFSPNTARIFAKQTADLDLSSVTFVFISENARAPLEHIKAAQILAKAPNRKAMTAAISSLL